MLCRLFYRHTIEITPLSFSTIKNVGFRDIKKYPNKQGKLVDISPSGLSFTYVKNGEKPNQFDSLAIFPCENDLVDDFSFQTISKHTIHDNAYFFGFSPWREPQNCAVSSLVSQRLPFIIPSIIPIAFMTDGYADFNLVRVDDFH